MFEAIRGKYLVQTLLTGVVFVAIVVLAITATQSDAVVDVVERFGYLGIFGFSVISGFNLAFPVPIIAFIPLFLEAGFALWTTVFVITLGMTLGDSVGYLIGNTGRKVVPNSQTRHRVIERIDQFKERHRLFPYVILLCYAALAPAPNEIIVIPMSFMGYKLRYMLAILFVGNFVFNILTALGVNVLSGLL